MIVKHIVVVPTPDDVRKRHVETIRREADAFLQQVSDAMQKVRENYGFEIGSRDREAVALAMADLADAGWVVSEVDANMIVIRFPP